MLVCSVKIIIQKARRVAANLRVIKYMNIRRKKGG